MHKRRYPMKKGSLSNSEIPHEHIREARLSNKRPRSLHLFKQDQPIMTQNKQKQHSRDEGFLGHNDVNEILPNAEQNATSRLVKI